MTAQAAGQVADARDPGLFASCVVALIATAFGFVIRAMVIGDWGHEFNLSETQKGELLGVGLWPFAITIVLFSLLLDRLGYRRSLFFALACHLVGYALILSATGYWMLYAGTLIAALGNGAVEAAVNPLIARVYRHDQATWLNRLHAGWPMGLVAGGLLAIGLGAEVDWRIKMACVLVPTLVYGVLVLRQSYPPTTLAVQPDSFRAMLAEVGVLGAALFFALTVTELGRVFELSLGLCVVLIVILTAAYALVARARGRPLFLLLALLMVPLATTELGTDSWITDLMGPPMQSLGLAGGWVLVGTSLLMAILRFSAGRFVHTLSPLGVLAAGSLIAAVGLYLLSSASGLLILVAAFLYGCGKAFLWPTMLGVVAERCPRGGALTLNLVAGVGMLSVGIAGAALLGFLQDARVADRLAAHDAAQGTTYTSQFLGDPRDSLFGAYRSIDEGRLASAASGDATTVAALRQGAKKAALRDVAWLPLGMALAFAALWWALRPRRSVQPGEMPPEPAQPRA